MLLVKERVGAVRYFVLTATVSVLVGCGAPSAPTMPPLQFAVSPPAAGAYTLRIEVDERCNLPLDAQVRTYEVSLAAIDSRYAYVTIRAVDRSLVGALWFGSRGGGWRAMLRDR